jgi:hypothetical protein
MKPNFLTVYPIALLALSSSIFAQPSSSENDQDTCARLNALKQERAELATSFTEAHPRMMQLKQMIERLTSVALEENPDVDVATVCITADSAQGEQKSVSESSEETDE